VVIMINKREILGGIDVIMRIITIIDKIVSWMLTSVGMTRRVGGNSH